MTTSLRYLDLRICPGRQMRGSAAAQRGKAPPFPAALFFYGGCASATNSGGTVSDLRRVALSTAEPYRNRQRQSRINSSLSILRLVLRRFRVQESKANKWTGTSA